MYSNRTMIAQLLWMNKFFFSCMIHIMAVTWKGMGSNLLTTVWVFICELKLWVAGYMLYLEYGTSNFHVVTTQFCYCTL